jgi:hypothetical protein
MGLLPANRIDLNNGKPGENDRGVITIGDMRFQLYHSIQYTNIMVLVVVLIYS